MGRVYAETKDGRSFLVEMECDDCGATTSPGSRELLEEWEKQGVYHDGLPGENHEWLYCGQCKWKHKG